MDREGKPRKNVLPRRKYTHDHIPFSPNPTLPAPGPHPEVNPVCPLAPIPDKQLTVGCWGKQTYTTPKMTRLSCLHEFTQLFIYNYEKTTKITNHVRRLNIVNRIENENI